MKTEEIQEVLEFAKSFGPMLDYAEEIIDLYGPTLHKLALRFILGACDLKIEAYKKYKETGLFTSDQCLALVNDTFTTIQKNLEKANKKGN